MRRRSLLSRLLELCLRLKTTPIGHGIVWCRDKPHQICAQDRYTGIRLIFVHTKRHMVGAVATAATATAAAVQLCSEKRA